MTQLLEGLDADVLRDIVGEWVDEGFTIPPYSDAHYDIFEALGVESEQYDIRRPQSE